MALFIALYQDNRLAGHEQLALSHLTNVVFADHSSLMTDYKT
jgi:hypothetical protein